MRTIGILSGVVLATALVLFAAQGSRHSLTIDNASDYDIHRLYVSSSDVESWGPDQLGTRILRSGSSFTLSDIRTGEYDIKFVDRDGDPCVLRRIKIVEDASWRLTTDWLLRCEGYSGHRGYSLSIQNDSRYRIREIYMSSSREESWGRDHLGDKILSPGSVFTISGISAGEWDVKFVDEDRDSCVLRRISITENTSWTLTTNWLLHCEGYRGR